MVDFLKDDPEKLIMKGQIVFRALLISTLIVQHVPAGPETATALRLLARIAESETNEDVTSEMLMQELDFLMADTARK